MTDVFDGISVCDRLQIMDRLARYSWSIDSGGIHAYLDNFMKDATFSHPLRDGSPGLFRGHEGITSFVREGFERRAEQSFGHQHQFNAILMELNGEGDVELRAYCVVLRHEFHRQYWPGGPSRRMGTWHANLGRIDGTWKIRTLEIRMWTDTALGAGAALVNRPAGSPGTRS